MTNIMLVLLLLLAGVACAPAISKPKVNTTVEQRLEALQDSVDVLTRLVKDMQTERTERLKANDDWSKCVDKCNDTVPFDDKEKYDGSERNKCHRECDKLKPMGFLDQC